MCCSAPSARVQKSQSLPMSNDISEYEKERLHRLQRNREMLQQLGIDKTSNLTIVDSAKLRVKPTEKLPELEGGRRRAKASVESQPNPARRSARARGEPAPTVTEFPDQLETTPPPEKGLHQELHEPLEYWKKKGVTPKLVVDGHFNGWVNPEYVEKFGLPASAEDMASGKVTASATTGGARGWSAAKSRSASLFKKNPNTFFYRHKAPGEEQWMGEWSPEEYQRFFDIASKYGAGDKWGLFSSHIPHRVGYQCANFYRQYVLPRGEIVDPNYMMTINGEAIFAPKNKEHRGIMVVEYDTADTHPPAETVDIIVPTIVESAEIPAIQKDTSTPSTPSSSEPVMSAENLEQPGQPPSKETKRSSTASQKRKKASNPAADYEEGTPKRPKKSTPSGASTSGKLRTLYTFFKKSG